MEQNRNTIDVSKNIKSESTKDALKASVVSVDDHWCANIPTVISIRITYNM